MSEFIKAHLYALQGANSEKYLTTCQLISSQINDEGETVLIMKNFDTSQLAVGQNVVLQLYSQKGICRAEAVITFIMAHSQANMVVRQIDRAIDRRNNVKVRVNLSAHILGQILPDGAKKRFLTPIPIQLKNLSVGGMLFTSAVPLALGSKYYFSITVNEVTFEITFTLLRQDPMTSPSLNLYGCSFEELPPDIDAFLCSYIYQIQLMERAKNRMIYDKD